MPAMPGQRGRQGRPRRAATPPGASSTGSASSGRRTRADEHGAGEHEPPPALRHEAHVEQQRERAADGQERRTAAGPPTGCQSRQLVRRRRAARARGRPIEPTTRRRRPSRVPPTRTARGRRASGRWRSGPWPPGSPRPATKATNRTEVNRAVAWPTSVWWSMRAAISQDGRAGQGLEHDGGDDGRGPREEVAVVRGPVPQAVQQHPEDVSGRVAGFSGSRRPGRRGRPCTGRGAPRRTARGPATAMLGLATSSDVRPWMLAHTWRAIVTASWSVRLRPASITAWMPSMRWAKEPVRSTSSHCSRGGGGPAHEHDPVVLGVLDPEAHVGPAPRPHGLHRVVDAGAPRPGGRRRGARTGVRRPRR